MLVSDAAEGGSSRPADPFESVNRRVFALNLWLDRSLFDPAAAWYQARVPAPVRTGVTNLLTNLDQAVGAVLALAAWDTDRASWLGRRVVINTTLGLGGVLDAASALSIPRPKREKPSVCFAGIPDGPYLVLPGFGAATTLQTGVAAGIVIGGFVVLGLVGGLIKEIVEVMVLIAVTQPTEADRRAYRMALRSSDPYAAVRDRFLQAHASRCP